MIVNKLTLGLMARLTGAVTLLGFVAACSSEPVQTVTGSTKSIYASLFGGKDEPPPTYTANAGPVEEVDEGPVCPETLVHNGSAHYAFYEKKAPQELKSVTYQATLTRTARECAFPEGGVHLKFGFAGRVLVGPRGSGGKVVVPVQAALIYRGTDVAWSKKYQIPVDVPEGARSSFFTHVEEELTYQLPPGHRLSQYRLEIGFENGSSAPAYSQVLN